MLQRLADDPKGQSDWVKTPVANLVCYKPSGIYFARIRIRGKLFRQSLKIDVISVAKMRLRDFVNNNRQNQQGRVLDVGGALRGGLQRFSLQ